MRASGLEVAGDLVRVEEATFPAADGLALSGWRMLGRPGMPSFGYHMSDDDIRALITYLRTLPAKP